MASVNYSPLQAALGMVQQVNAQNAAAAEQNRIRKQQNRQAFARGAGQVAGAIAGGIATGGNPVGISLGASLGGAAGGALTGSPSTSSDLINAGVTAAGYQQQQQQKAAEQSAIQQAMQSQQQAMPSSIQANQATTNLTNLYGGAQAPSDVNVAANTVTAAPPPQSTQDLMNVVGTPQPVSAADQAAYAQQQKNIGVLQAALGSPSPLKTALGTLGLENALNPHVKPVVLPDKGQLVDPTTGRVIAGNASSKNFRPMTADELKDYPGATGGQINTSTNEVKDLHYPTGSDSISNAVTPILNKLSKWDGTGKSPLTQGEQSVLQTWMRSPPINNLLGSAGVGAIPGVTGNAGTPSQTSAVAQPTTKAQFDALPKGAHYIDPNDPTKQVRIKP